MKHTETVADAFDLACALTDHKKISTREAKTFWQNQKTNGKVDLIFKQAEKKLKLLWQKIKDGSATDREYTSAFLLVSEDDLLAQETYDCNQNRSIQLTKNEDPVPEPCEEEVTSPDSAINDATLPPKARAVHFIEHKCGEACLSKVNPYFSRRGNPLMFPIKCSFQRWHAKSSLLSRAWDVLYKAPCGRSLRNFAEVKSYLLETECHFLFLDYFSFNTFLQLGRNLVTNPVVSQEADISKDVELVPVSFSNEIDNTKPSSFIYRKSPWPRGYSLNNFKDLFIGCCDCKDGCLDVSKCECLQLTARACNNNGSPPNESVKTHYTHNRLQAPIPIGLYECNVSCKCDRRKCQNRVVQRGLQVQLQVFKTKERGWGVRCLDDLDKGTFVCIYAGRILMKASNIDAEDTSPCAMQTDNNMADSFFCKRKRHISLSDSEVNLHPPNSSSSQKHRNTPVTLGSSLLPNCTPRSRFTRLQGRTADYPSIRRPKTKTSILQKRRRQLMQKGAVTEELSSEDEDFIVPMNSQKPLHTHHSGYEGGEAERKDDPGYLSDNSTLSIQSNGSNIQLSVCKQMEAPQHPESEEQICVLDASKEGNVARFLNHSCWPNLFVQPVFVETHSKQFPWLAFFTKRHIKAGTELTWDYNYSIGSVPEVEVPCLCGHKDCKNRTI